MPQSWSSQDSDDLDDIHAWMARRNAQVALRPEADDLARDLWTQTIRNGNDLYAGNPSDLTAIGLAALGGSNSYSVSAANHVGESGHDDGVGAESSLPSTSNYPTVSELEVVGPPATQAPHLSLLDSLNHNPIARAGAGAAGYLVGLPAGALSAGWHALEGVGHGLNFAGGLVLSQDAREKAWDDAQTATHDALQYGRSVIANPSRLASDALSGAKAANRSLNPFATPIPDTASGAFGHELGIGANVGEAVTNIAGVFAAPEVFAGVKAARAFEATRDANIAEMMAGGLTSPQPSISQSPTKARASMR